MVGAGGNGMGIVGQRKAEKEKAARKTGRLCTLCCDGEGELQDGLPKVMKPLCTTRVTARSP